MKINRKILIFAIAIGLLTVIILNYYINNLESIHDYQVPYSQVVIAANKIPANVKITENMVELKSVPAESIHPEAFTSLDEIIGGVSNSEIVKGEQILLSRVHVDMNEATLAYRVPKNMRAVSIPTSEVSGVGGYINIGDRIDILVTYDDEDINPVSTTYTQLQNIEVAAIGSVIFSGGDEQTALPNSITVFVEPAQAEVLAYAISNGSIFFSLRNPADSQKMDLTFYNSTNFSTYNER